MVSPKMMITTVMMTVPSHTFSVLPVSFTTSTVMREEAAMFTRLLPMRMAPRASSKRSAIFAATPARLEPSSRRCSSRRLEQEEKAISEPEKKPERITQARIPSRMRRIDVMLDRLLPLPWAEG